MEMAVKATKSCNFTIKRMQCRDQRSEAVSGMDVLPSPKHWRDLPLLQSVGEKHWSSTESCSVTAVRRERDCRMVGILEWTAHGDEISQYVLQEPARIYEQQPHAVDDLKFLLSPAIKLYEN